MSLWPRDEQTARTVARVLVAVAAGTPPRPEDLREAGPQVGRLLVALDSTTRLFGGPGFGTDRKTRHAAIAGFLAAHPRGRDIADRLENAAIPDAA